MQEDDLRRAIALCKQGENLKARALLETIVKNHPEMDIAWIWLADTYVEIPERMLVLQEWLKINPKSRNARNWLAAYKKKDWKVLKSAQDHPETPAGQVLHYQGDESIPVLVRRSDRIREKRKNEGKKPPFLVPAIAIAFLLIGSVILYGWIFQRQWFPSIPSFVATSSSPPPTRITTMTNLPQFTTTSLPSSTASPSRTSSPVFTSTSLPNVATINVDQTFLYMGPSADHYLIQCGLGNCVYLRGTQVLLLEQNSLFGDIWFRVSTPDGKTGWLHKGWLLFAGDQELIPTASAYPTYPPSATP